MKYKLDGFEVSGMKNELVNTNSKENNKIAYVLLSLAIVVVGYAVYLTVAYSDVLNSIK